MPGEDFSVLLGEVGLVMTVRSLWRDAAWAGAAGWLAWDRDRERGGTMSGDLADLARRLSPGAVVTDEGVIEGYRRDCAATVPAGRPWAVVRPGTVAEVGSTLRWAAENAVPVVPRGAGTGLSGGANAIDGCLMLSLERFTAIREINTRHQCAVAEAGVLTADLGRTAAAAGMSYPPDPGSFEICTIGGNLATNAGGMRCVKYGVTRDSALGLEVVLADGTVLRTGSGARKRLLGGTITGEHGVGVLKQAWLRQQLGPASLAVHQAIKTALDPVGILNPGRSF